MDSKFITPFLILILVIPFGVAAQNIALGLVVIGFTVWIFSNPKLLRAVIASLHQLKNPTILAVLWIGWMSFCNVISPIATQSTLSDFVAGQLLIFIVPIISLSIRNYHNVILGERFSILSRRFTRLALYSVVFLTLVCLSQRLVGWAWIDGALVTGIKFRSQGFYSHPLTLAYVACLFFPLILASAETGVTHSTSKWAIATGCIIAILIMTESRTVLAVTLPIGIGFVVTGKFRPRLKVAVLAGFTIIVLAGSIIPNPLRTKFFATLSTMLATSDQAYLFDREIFWHAYLTAFWERPFLGWGTEWPKDFVVQIYENIGQAGLKNKYNAHNQFIQFLAEGGVLGLGLFLAWLGWYLKAMWAQRSEFRLARGYLFAVLGLFLASLTQNSFYDSEVRYSFVIVLSLWVFTSPLKAPK